MAQIALDYTATEINTALGRITNLIEFVGESLDIVQLKENDTNIYPITKASAVFLDEDFTQDVNGAINALNNTLGDINTILESI